MKPILFNTEMVRAILEGRKTVTRRVIKPQPTYSPRDGFTWKGGAYGTDLPPTIKGACYNLRCAAPYQVNDILWVRETWLKADDGYYYRADETPHSKRQREEYGYKWKPSIHMPKEAARIFLRVTGVRVERLQDITEEQAEAEGIRGYTKDGKLYKYAASIDWWSEFHYKHRKIFKGNWWQDMPRTAKEAFHHLWNSTLGRKDTPEWYANNWSGNPYVWVIEFEVISKSEALGGNSPEG